MWLARFYAALPEVQAQHPKARWLFLTLTVRNCPISDLRETLRRFVDREMPRDLAAQWDKANAFPREVFRKLAGS